MIKLYLLVLLSGLFVSAKAQKTIYNYDRRILGTAYSATYYQPKSFQTTDQYIYDKGSVSLRDVSIFYQWRKKSLYSLQAGFQSRFAEFKDSAFLQTRDYFFDLGMLIGKRVFISDHKTFLDISIGTSVRKLFKRKYLAEVGNASMLEKLPRNNSFANSISGAFLTDIKLHYELVKSEVTIFIGLSGSADLYQLGSSAYNKYTRRYNTLALSIGFTEIF